MYTCASSQHNLKSCHVNSNVVSRCFDIPFLPSELLNKKAWQTPQQIPNSVLGTALFNVHMSNSHTAVLWSWHHNSLEWLSRCSQCYLMPNFMAPHTWLHMKTNQLGLRHLLHFTCYDKQQLCMPPLKTQCSLICQRLPEMITKMQHFEKRTYPELTGV